LCTTASGQNQNDSENDDDDDSDEDDEGDDDPKDDDFGNDPSKVTALSLDDCPVIEKVIDQIGN